ncbi:transglycosylase domain-containing protein [Paenibacillus sp. OV219]|uniref:transglycosylase domain-containing protein n=1 Tax=Paenibacillus sp. OV219 TaxID=1884377 RepID=UPI0008AB79B5|nr:penicillin-binding protein 1A [Paenibacillus sp. OV219]SEO03153.1 penicillin-binding protein 2A [Paenibacillus sp. OV219]
MNSNHTKESTNKRRIGWTKIIVSLAVAMVFVGLASWFALRVMVDRQDISLLAKPLPAETVIMDDNEKEASRIKLNTTIEPVSYHALPKQLIDAVVAVEDKRFLEHHGTDVWGIGRALFTNVTSGKTVEGASTITQQLAKNVFLSQERTWSRKWNEALLAKKIEQTYNKQQIMEMYLNQIYFGEGAWGIKRAASTYFGKSVQKLTLSESALLAGIIRAPSALSPYKHMDEAKDRRNVVLQLMRDQGKISSSTYEAASKLPIRLGSAKSSRGEGLKYPYFVDQIIREASEQYGLSENEVLHGGLRIYTTLNTTMQQAAEHVYADASVFPSSSSDQLIQSGAVLLDPRNGGIKALIGGRGDQPFRGFNRAVQLKRQPGSTMKPISVYTPAFERGYLPSDTLMDEPIDFGGYAPKNAGGGYHGEVSIYDAIVNSYNIPAVELLNEMGIDAGMDAAERFGIKLSDADRTLGLALGGLQEGVSPLTMAAAFSTFSNDGKRFSAHAIVRIESADGELLAEAVSEEPIQVTDPAVARTMTSMLEGVVQEGTGEAAAIEGRPIAGKTGTTEMPGTGGEGIKDNWFVGYTPQLVGAVWLGYDHTDASHYLTTTSKAAAAVFHALMSEAMKDEPVMDFPKAPQLSVNKHGDQSDKGKEKEPKWKPGLGRDHPAGPKEPKQPKDDHKPHDKNRPDGNQEDKHSQGEHKPGKKKDKHGGDYAEGD